VSIAAERFYTFCQHPEPDSLIAMNNLPGMCGVIAERGGRLENGLYGHSRFCNTDFDDKWACLNLSGV
ncbi:hypothetical protein, partial [Salmonella enterica]|uniref:hypothetical protein n=1 Tax=Salmonella enterica TaxID=28901 RepID=UPI0021B43AC9